MIDQMLAMIEAHDTCVLATCLNDVPLCSLMAYVPGEQGKRLYLVTSSASRKFANLEANPRVSLLIDTRRGAAGKDRAQVQALTVQGICQAVEAGCPEDKEIKERFVGRHTHLAELVQDPQARVLEVRIETLMLLNGPSQAFFERIV